jgi:hypothetical protein
MLPTDFGGILIGRPISIYLLSLRAVSKSELVDQVFRALLITDIKLNFSKTSNVCRSKYPEISIVLPCNSTKNHRISRVLKSLVPQPMFNNFVKKIVGVTAC